MSEIRYCIRTPEGKLLVDTTLAESLKGAKLDFMFLVEFDTELDWNYHYKRGYRGVKVEIKELTK